MALTYILSSPQLFTLHRVIVSTFNTPLRALIVAYTLHLLNLTHIPILIGNQTSTRSCYQAAWLPYNFSLTSYRAAGGVIVDDGVTALISFIDAWPSSSPPLRYVEIAPASSLGAVLTRSPASASKLTVFAMNGCIRTGYGNASHTEAEYNTVTDIAASQLMYAAAPQYAAPGLVVAPLDSTIFEQFNGDEWKAFLALNDSSHPAVALLLASYAAWWEAGGKNNGALQPYSPEVGTSTMFDVQAAYSAGRVRWDGGGGGGCVVGEVEGLVTECLQGVVVNATGYVEVGVKGGTNVSVQVDVVGGRASPYKAIEGIGRIVLAAIASVRSPPTPPPASPVPPESDGAQSHANRHHRRHEW